MTPTPQQPQTLLVKPYRPEHPVWRVFTREEAERILAAEGAEGYNRRMGKRNAMVRAAEEDPFNCTIELVTWKLADVFLGFRTWEQLCADPLVPQRWKDSQALPEFVENAVGVLRMLLLLGGNRAAKTQYMLWRAMKCVADTRSEVWCFHQNERMSIDYHQRWIFHYLPNEWKRLGKGKGLEDPTYISYSQQNGFSSNKLTCPNGSLLSFLNYEQDPEKTIEGGELGAEDKRVSVGYIADELIPLGWVETLEFRLATRGALGLIGFTPVKGYTDTVAAFMDGAGPVYAEYWELIRDEARKLVPLVMKCADKRKAVILFHTHYNPFANFREVRDAVAEKSDDEKLTRLAGLPTKRVGARFVRYDEAVHVVPASRIYEAFETGLVQKWAWPGTNWMVVDPARQKRWFMLWGRVDVYGRVWIYREWPSPTRFIPGVGLPDPWAKAGSTKGHNHDGIPAAGSRPLGWGLHEYKEEIARLERWAAYGTDQPVEAWLESDGSADQVHGRMMDSRFANTPSQTSSGNTTLLEETGLIRLHFQPTFSQEGQGTVNEGAELISSALAGKPGEGPGLFISEECENLRFAMRLWTGMDGQKGATKDPIDCLRYFLMARIGYVDERPTHHRARGYGAGTGASPTAEVNHTNKKQQIFGRQRSSVARRRR